MRDIERMLEQARALGTVFFDISGGDPLIVEREFILETLRLASAKDLSACISTNGTNLTKDYLEEMVSVGLQKLKFSLYGATSRTHDHFTRVPGSFEHVMRAVELSKRAGVEVWVNCVVIPGNLDEFQRLASLLDPLDVDLVQLSSIVPCGRGKRADSYQFSEAGFKNAIRTLENSLSSLRHAFTITLYPNPETPPFAGRHCDYFYDRLVVDPQGNVIPCCLLPDDLQHRLGNIREGLSKVCSDQRVREDPVFYWLDQGHDKMRQALGYEKVSHNLCAVCIDMLYRLSGTATGK